MLDCVYRSVALVRIELFVLIMGIMLVYSVLFDRARLAFHSLLEQLNQSKQFSVLKLYVKTSVMCSLQYRASIIQVKSYPHSQHISIVMNLISQPVWTSPNESV